MSDNEIKFLTYEEASKIVAAIQEEEDIHNNDKQILTVYNYEDKEICWFDFAEVIADIPTENKKPSKEEVQDYILRRIPDWAKEI